MADPLGKPRRRDLLAGSAGMAAAAAMGIRARADAQGSPAGVGPTAVFEVDVHCHTFCSADLPIVGFVAHHIPGLVELSRWVTRWPELVVRALVGGVATLPNAVAPTGEDELGRLREALARADRALIGPVAPLDPAALEAALAALGRHLPFSVSEGQRRILARYLDTLYLVAHGRASIAATLARTFPSVSLFTPALVDYDAWSEDRSPTPLWQQILIQESIARLSVAGRIGRTDARFHPFVAFDPRREVEGPRPVAGAGGAAHPGAAPKRAQPAAPAPDTSALNLVRYAIEVGGFLGVKLYPPVGFAPFENARLRPRQAISAALDEALGSLYAYCQAEEVPILTHASAANEYGLGIRELVAPARWTPALERFPSLRLDLGHFGHDYGVPADSSPGAERGGWIYQAAALIDRFPNVYADLADSPLVYDAAYATRLQGILGEVIARHPKVKRRLMYGSDWWLSRLDPDAEQAVDRFRAVLGAMLLPSELADVMGRNALRFLGFLDDNNRPRDARAARRLRAFYGGAGRPPWLPPAG